MTFAGITRQYIDILKPSSTYDTSGNFYKKYGQQIINKANEYYLAIDRFHIPTDSIPIFIFNPAFKYYNVTMSYNGFSSGSVGLDYIPTNEPSISYSYRYVYTFDIFLKMINDAFIKAYNILKGLVTLPIDATYPHFELNNTTNMLSYIAQTTYYDEEVIEANRILVYINLNLSQFIDGIPTIIDTRLSDDKQTRLICYNKHNNIRTNITPNVYVMESNYSVETLLKWHIARGILLKTDCIPINTEFLPSGFGTNINEATILNSQGILANFDIIYTSANVKPLSIQYIITGVYKLIDLTGDSGIDTIDIKIFWYDRYNNLYPLHLDIGDALSLRLVFIKKGTAN